ncbi:MAG: hypothetical protein ACXQTI_08700 [Candidatus Nezhaarchaeales archaeon]
MRSLHSLSFMVIMALLALSCMPVVAASLDEPRHVNPETLSPKVPPATELESIFNEYMNSMSMENFMQANASLLTLMEAYYPENIRDSVSRFYSFLNNLTVEISDVKEYILLGSMLLDKLMLNESVEAVMKGFRDLAKANLTLSTTEDMAVRVSKALHGAKLNVSAMEELLSKYHDELVDLYSRILEAMKKYANVTLKPTNLSISVDKCEAWIGSIIIIRGSLTSLDEPLPERVIEMHIDDNKFYLKTDANGSFSMAFRIPYIYKTNLTIYAIFIPQGPDVGVYRVVTSNVIVIKLLSLETNLTASLSKYVALPGDEILIRGRISLANADLMIKAFNEKIVVQADEAGLFEVELKVPHNAQEGPHTITISFGGFREWRPANLSLKLNVVRERIQVIVSYPHFVFGGLPFDIEGQVLLNGSGIERAEVRALYLDKTSSLITDVNGSFKLSINFGFLCSTGLQHILIEVPSPYYWARGALVRIEVFNVNIIMVLALTALIAVLVHLGLRELRHKRPKEEPIVEVKPKAIEVKPTHKVEKALEMPGYYREAVNIVERYTGVKLLASDTVREYLNKISSLLKEAYNIFKELSLRLEEQVYGGKRVNEDECYELLKSLRKILEGIE